MNALRYGTVNVDEPEPDDLVLRSVTTIINVISNSDPFIWWARYGVAELAINLESQWKAHVNAGDRKAATKFLAGKHEEVADRARKTGSKVHDALEDYALTGVRPDVPEIEPYIAQFDGWLASAQPTYQAAELTVFNPAYGYAGTLDAIAEIGGVRFLIDYKTSEKSFDRKDKPTRPYPDTAGLQVAAYAYATHAAIFRARKRDRPFSPRDYYLSPDELQRCVAMPDVDAALVVHITPEHCAAYPFVLTDDMFEAFLHVIEAYRWAKHTSHTVMGPPLELPEGGANVDHWPTATPA